MATRADAQIPHLPNRVAQAKQMECPSEQVEIGDRKINLHMGQINVLINCCRSVGTTSETEVLKKVKLE